MESGVQDPSSGSYEVSELALAEHIRKEQVHFVFIQSALPIFFSPAAAAILSFALRSVVARERLIFWTVGLVVIAVARVLLVGRYPKEVSTTPQVHTWEKIFVASIVLVDLWWGLGCLFLLTDTLADRALVFCFLMMMAGGHSVSYAAHKMTVILGVLALAAPITVAFTLRADTFHGAFAVAAGLFLLATFRSIGTLGYFFSRTHRLAHEVQREKERAEKLARLDFLTELNNRRAFFELGNASVKLCRRYSHPAAALMLDIDHFKAINDKFGHAAGDAVIRKVASLIREVHRTTDIAGRMGGEEFAVLLPETQLVDAMATAERLRAQVGETTVQYAQHTIRFTTSLGVAALRTDESLEQLLVRADGALYEAKHAGRNRVLSATG